MTAPLPDLCALAVAGHTLTLRVTPGAKGESILTDGAVLRVRVTAAPENGKANAAVLRLLARAMGIPKSRLTLMRGETARDKVVRVD